jgi:hypothetical protein
MTERVFYYICPYQDGFTLRRRTTISFLLLLCFVVIPLHGMVPAESCCDTGESGMQSCCAADPVTGTSPCEDKSVSIETSDDYMAENAVTGVKNIFHFTLPWLCSSEDEYHISNQKYSLTVPDLRRPPTDASVDLSGIQVFLL